MLLQTTRAKVLESQLNSEITNMQARNAQIKALNDRLNTEQKTLNEMDPSKTDKTSVDKRAAQQKVVSDLKSSIDSLNSESQINMIRVQGLVSKRNEAFELLTNLLSKFQKPIDTIVGNMR
jgi:phage shock protein A